MDYSKKKIEEITMVTGKKYKLYNGYTFGAGRKLKSSFRYGCTSSCGVYLYMTFDGKLAKPMSIHKHLPPRLYLLPDGTYVRTY